MLQEHSCYNITAKLVFFVIVKNKKRGKFCQFAEKV